MPAQALSHVEDVLADVQPVLGVPFTNLIFHKLANWPDFLTLAWHRTRPVVLTVEFQRYAAVLAALAKPDVAPAAFAWPDGLDTEDLHRVRLLTDAYATAQPQLMLLVAGWLRAIEGRPARSATLTPRTEPGRGDPAADVPMVGLPPSDPDVTKLFGDMIGRRGHPGVASYYRSLAQWPSLLNSCWHILEPTVLSPDYDMRVRRLVTAADLAVTDLGFGQAGLLGLPQHNNTLRVLLAAWRDVQVPQLMLDTLRLKASFASATLMRR